MTLTQLSLVDVRNYGALDFRPLPGLNVLLGPNAQGKSNLLEAIGLLGTGKSFRTAREGEMIRRGTASAVIAGEARVAAGTIRLSCSLTAAGGGTRKVYAVNGQSVRYASYLGRMRVVTFVPSHLQLVAGAPGLRRAFLNAALSQESAAYYSALAAYGKFLAQKNALLRGAVAPDEALLATYDERIVATGSTLMTARSAYLEELGRAALGVHRDWVGERDGELEIAYAPSVPFDDANPDAIAAAFAERLAALRPLELARRTSLVGPHRDDVSFRLGGRALDAFGSQGQQRTAVLALKVAEYALMAERGGEAPILLLDDVLSELDAERQHAFLRGVGSVEQAFITTTAGVDLPVAATYAVERATLREVA
jgi:DNA replication and repair protein RecF